MFASSTGPRPTPSSSSARRASGCCWAYSMPGRAAQTMAGLADSAIGLKFSRGEEDQADQGGLENMVAAGYNPQGMIQLFQALEKVSGNGGSVGRRFSFRPPADLGPHQTRPAADRGPAKASTRFPPLTPLNYSSPSEFETQKKPLREASGFSAAEIRQQ